ncbi:MAG TPA: hypothetical protein VGN23_06975 [Verrucomicrobiae bacterium]|jgi:hypothetical protein
MIPRSADFEVGDTAGWETCATSFAEFSCRDFDSAAAPDLFSKFKPNHRNWHAYSFSLNDPEH